MSGTKFVLVVIMGTLLLTSCSVPDAAVRRDGWVVVELVHPGIFRAGGRYFTSGDLGVALGNMVRSGRATHIEVLIPSKLFDSKNPYACNNLMRSSFVSSNLGWDVWRYFTWTPSDESSKKEVQCDIPIVA